MAVSNFVRNNDHGRITVNDGSGTPVSHVCAFDKGDTSLSGVTKKLNEVTKVERRGKFISASHAGRRYPQFSFSAWVTDLSASPGTLLEMLLGSNTYSANVSTLGAGANIPYALDITVEFQDETGAFAEAYVLHDCLITDISWTEAAEGNSISVTFEVLGAITGDGMVAAEIS